MMLGSWCVGGKICARLEGKGGAYMILLDPYKVYFVKGFSKSICLFFFG